MNYTHIISLMAVSFCILYYCNYRSARDVYYDLSDDPEDAKTHINKKQISPILMYTLLVLPLLFGIALYFTIPLQMIVFAMLMIVCIGYIFIERRKKSIAHSIDEEVDASLPIVMERIVMAVEAGLDVIPALKAVTALKSGVALGEKRIHELLVQVIQIAEKGTPLDDALKNVSISHSSQSLKHGFLHLGMAYRDGGELIGPLRELSDATQLLYQESIEEEIAKLPVKATAPLVLIFTGLIMCIISLPLIQLFSFLGQLSSQQGGG